MVQTRGSVRAAEKFTRTRRARKSSLGLGRLVPGEREHAIKGLLGTTDLGRAKESHRMAFDLSIIFGWPGKTTFRPTFHPTYQKASVHSIVGVKVYSSRYTDKLSSNK